MRTNVSRHSESDGDEGRFFIASPLSRNKLTPRWACKWFYTVSARSVAIISLDGCSQSVLHLDRKRALFLLIVEIARVYGTHASDSYWSRQVLAFFPAGLLCPSPR